MSSPEADRATAEQDGVDAGVPTREDAFYDGRFHLLQPVGTGLRSGLDALLLAAALPPEAEGLLADLGSGAGAVGLAACCRAPRVTTTLVEADSVMAALARRTTNLEANHLLRTRIRVVEVDVTAVRAEREQAGLMDGSFDHVLTNPPYHPDGHRASADGLRAKATVAAGDDFLVRWMRVCGALLKTGGSFAAVLRADALPNVLETVTHFIGGAHVLPIHPREEVAAHRIIVSAVKGSKAPFTILPGIALHDSEGGATQIGRAISAGSARLTPPA